MSTTFTPEFFTKLTLETLSSELVDTPTYIYVGDPVSNVSSVADANASVQTKLEQINTMLFGKRILDENVMLMVNRSNWTANTVYDMYDDTDADLEDKDFYIINSSRSVYKCLYNNEGEPSTVEPTSLDPLPVTLADGYTWHYMYRLTVNQLGNFATEDLLPVFADANTTANAVSGAIDIIVVEEPGTDYVTTTGTIAEVVSNTVFRIDSSASATDGIYVNSDFYISAGPGVGSISTITAYSSNATGRYVTVEDPLGDVTISSTYVIAPKVAILGNGSGATAYATVNNGTIESVSILDRGTGYTSATVEIQANTAYGSGAEVRAILSPPGGHGSDVVSELYARNMLISVDFVGDESNTIPVDLSFSHYGIVRNVKQAANTAAAYTANTFDNTAKIETNQINGNFAVGDTLTSDTDATVNALVAQATSNTIIVLYQGYGQIEAGDSLANEEGILASANTIISQPNISLDDAQVMTLTNINTVTHTANTQETVNIIFRV